MGVVKHVRRLAAYTPGEQPKSRRVVKLNTNENPYPPSPACAEVLKAFDLDRLRRYPDPNFSELRAALADLNGAAPENVFVGNGSDEVLSIAAKTFVEDDERIGSLDPSYSLYKTLAAIRNVSWYGLDEAAFARQWGAGGKGAARPLPQGLFLLTNPNAPTGRLLAPDVVARFARAFRGVVIVDEAYADFASATCMTLATASRNRNVIVMRTFSKSYSLAGLRVGYCVGPTALIDAMYKVKDSYNVDAVAQAVALAAVRDQKWMKANVAKVVKTRGWLANELTRRGWDVVPSESNFLFARPPAVAGECAAETAQRLFNGLREKGVFVRYFKGPKTGERLRITVGTDAEVRKLLATLKAVSRETI